MQPDIKIRLGQLTDLDALVSFNQAMALETEARELDENILIQGVEKLLNHPDSGFYLVAESAGELLGSLMVTFEWSDWQAKNYYWIQSVYVRPSSRKQGIYRKLYQKVKTLAEHNGGAASFRLYVEQDNKTAQQAYKNLGMNPSYYLMYEEV